MSFQFDDSLLNFDLDLLHQTQNKVVDINEKCRKAVNVTKKKIVATDSLIRKYYEKKEDVDQLEKALYTTRDECKKAYIDIQILTDKCAHLEKDVQILRTTNKELLEKTVQSDSEIKAFQSHTKQLQILVKDNETIIESLKIENQLQKDSIKDFDKKKKENETLTRYITLMKDIIFGKRKLSANFKDILKKHAQNYEYSDNDSLLGEEVLSDNETEMDLSVLPTLQKIPSSQSKDKNIQVDGKLISTKDDDLDSDPGLGSSLAFSDAEKCFNSPDYFMDHSPMSSDIKENSNKIFVDIATSPISFERYQDSSHTFPTSPANVATSPIIHADELVINIEPENDEDVTEIESKYNLFADIEEDILTPKNGFNIRISPESPINTNTLYSSTSNYSACDSNKGITQNHDDSIDLQTSNFNGYKQYKSKKSNKEKVCLELNNSNKFNEVNDRDCEVEMILSSMRLEQLLVTPIPSTPFQSSPSPCGDISKMSCDDVSSQIIVCKDAMKVSEENKALQAQICQLAKDVANLRNCLENSQKVHTSCVYEHSQDVETVGTDYVPAQVSGSQHTPVLKTSHNDHVEVLQIDTGANAHLIPLNSATSYEMTNQESSQEEVDQHITNDDISNKSNHTDFKKSSRKLEFEESLPTLINANSSSTFEESDVNNFRQSSNQTENLQEELCDTEDLYNPNCKKSLNVRKLTKLEKFKRKLLPKTKIQRATGPPLEKMQRKHRKLLARNASTVNSESEIKLNNKIAYEKALKVMSELKSGQNAKELKPRKNNTITIKKIDNSIEKVMLYEDDDKKVSKSPLIFRTSSPQKLKESVILPDYLKTKHSKEICILENILLTEPHNINNKSKTKNNNVENGVKVKMTDPLALNYKENESVALGSTSIEVERLIPKRRESSSKQDSVSDQALAKTAENKIKSPIKKYNSFSSSTLSHTEVHKELVIPITKCDKITDIGNLSPSKKVIATRSKTKYVEDINTQRNSPRKNNTLGDNNNKPAIELSPTGKSDKSTEDIAQGTRKRLKRMSADKPDVDCKRMLRSSSLRQSKSEESSTLSDIKLETINDNNNMIYHESAKSIVEENKIAEAKIVSYEDLDLFNENDEVSQLKIKTENSTNNKETTVVHPKQSILCKMLDKYGKHSVKNYSKKLPDSVVAKISKTIEKEIAEISSHYPNNTEGPMQKFIDTIKKWNQKHFIVGLVDYLKNEERKLELFNKVSSPPAPSMTKSEQILLYALNQLRSIWPSIDIIDCVLCNIEYTIFKLNRTPEFDVIESMSHFYAIVCRYYKMKSRLRLFMLDALYCIQFKAVSLIKQCLEVWSHILPLAHMGIARSPLVTCMVYLLHFYKCEDKFNRVQEIRNVLSRRYFYQITQWNEPKILEMFKTAIRNIRAIPVEMKQLRIALIVLAKRHGPKWCHKNIVKNMLLPIIEKEGYSENSKLFSVSMLGPLLKPYPVDMKVHCEIIMNMFVDMLKENSSPEMEEAIFTSLIYMSRHNYTRVLKTLLMWGPSKISPVFEGVMCDFVREKPLKAWKSILCKINLSD